ncbi:protein containing Thiamine pyrophosphate enzyme, partial [mine drainage metagenome]
MIMARTVADVIVETLVSCGVKRIYGIPGDSIDPLVDSIRRNKEIQYVQGRHEEGSALEATFEARMTGMPVACMGTSGPGSIHLLNGLYEAKLDHVPVIA